MTVGASASAGPDGRIPGCVIGLVEELQDPDGQGRIRVSYPWLDGQTLSNWAPIAAPMAGNGRGLWAQPELRDEVVLSFDRGRMDHPVVIGFTWNGQDDPPDPDGRVRMWMSTNGHQIMMADEPESQGALGAMSMRDAHGNMVTMANGVVTVKATGVLRLQAPSIILEVAGVQRVVSPSPKPI